MLACTCHMLAAPPSSPHSNANARRWLELAYTTVRLKPAAAACLSYGCVVVVPPAVQVREIATIKLPDLNCTDLEAACNTVMGTARNMGITVEA